MSDEMKLEEDSPRAIPPDTDAKDNDEKPTAVPAKRKRTRTTKRCSCAVCGKKFSRAADLRRHERTHSGDKPFVCEICSRAFSLAGNLAVHRRTHSGEKQFVCEICRRAFSLASSLVKHRRTHSGEKPFICEICRRAFPTSSRLAVHKRRHTGEKPYCCPTCQRRFVQCSNLRRHELTHSSATPYACVHSGCGKTFRRRDTLSLHMRRKHREEPILQQEEEQIECEECKGVFFETVQKLVDHFDQVHDLRE
jgi:uncharacterized Zn-finger protein